MGQTTSNVVKKVVSPMSYMMGWSGSGQGDDMAVAKLANPFVYKRRGSMYFDEDGDLAHEFFEERRSNIDGRTKMKKLKRNLTPQGEVELPFPRLNKDLPIVMCEALR